MDVSGIIRRALPKLDAGILSKIQKAIEDAGPSELSDLKFLKEEDLKHILKPLMRRRLLDFFNNKFNPHLEDELDEELPELPQEHHTIIDHSSNSMDTVHGGSSYYDGSLYASSQSSGRQHLPLSAPDYPPPHPPQPAPLATPIKLQPLLDEAVEQHLPLEPQQSVVIAAPSPHFLDALSNETNKQEDNPAEQTFNTIILRKISAMQKMIKDQDRIVNDKLNRLLRVQHQYASSLPDGRAVIEGSNIPQPACTLEELDILLRTEGLAQHLISFRGSTTLDTTRRVLRRLLAKPLAVRFSLTGLGEKRMATKLSFRDHTMANHVVDAVQVTFPDATRSDVYETVRRVLKSAPDWDGGRVARRTPLKGQQEHMENSRGHHQGLLQDNTRGQQNHLQENNVAQQVHLQGRSQQGGMHEGSRAQQSLLQDRPCQ